MMAHKSNNGSVLVWGIIVSAVLVILVGITLTISFSYYNRSIKNNSEKQAYFTARSVVESITGEIKNETEIGIAILDRLNSVGTVVDFSNINFSEQSANRGETVAFIELIADETIRMTASTTVAGVTETVVATLEKGAADTTELPIGEDFPGLTVPDNATIVTHPFSINSNTRITDLYIDSTGSVTFQNSAAFSGTIYAQAQSVLTISQGSKFSGTLYAQENTAFSFSRLHNQFNGTIYVVEGAVILVNNIEYKISKNESNVIATPVTGNSRINSDFLRLLRIYTGAEIDENWGDAVYE